MAQGRSISKGRLVVGWFIVTKAVGALGIGLSLRSSREIGYSQDSKGDMLIWRRALDALQGNVRAAFAMQDSDM
jgi:hypothetical protein